jgi:hypothetical protein
MHAHTGAAHCGAPLARAYSGGRQEKLENNAVIANF